MVKAMACLCNVGGLQSTQAICLQADVFNPSSWRDQLKGAIGLVSCLGGFGSNEFMFKVSNGHFLSTLSPKQSIAVLLKSFPLLVR